MDPNKEQSLFQSESPDPSLIHTVLLRPDHDYKSQSWKNGLGMTDEIAIYPSDKDFTKDDFFWRFSTNLMHADCNFSVFPGYDCTTILLPGTQQKQPTLSLSHLGTESTTKVQPLFPYTWQGEWTTTCKVSRAPVRCLQFMLRRKLGKAQIRIEKIGAYETDLQGDVDSGKNMLFGAFAIVYVVEGVVSVKLDENHAHRQNFELVSGQTLYIERDEDASPTSILLNAIDQEDHSAEASIILIQIEEGKTFGGVLSSPSIPQQSPVPVSPKDEGIVPSQRRPSLRRPSLLVPMERDQKDSVKAPTAVNTMPPDLSDKLSQLDLHEKRRRSTKRRDSLNLELFDPNAIYEPPPFALIHTDTQMPPPVIRDKLEVEDFPLSTISTAWIKMMTQGLSEWLKLPVIVCRGSEDGPVLGITAAVHGNELNGVPCIHRVISQIDVSKLKGTVVAVPCVNVWGYLKFQREFADGRDLNRQFPGKEDGYASQVFCHHLMTKIISQFNYMVDLHTASFGRVNSYYVRADMNDDIGASMAKLQQPQILLHNSGQDGTLRSAAAARGIKAITVEIGNPQTFQDVYIQWSFMGIMRIMDHFEMYSLQNINASEPITLSLSSKELAGPSHTVLCSRGFWIYTKTGGILEVYPNVNTLIRKGDIIARIKNMFGNIAEEYFAPCTGVVIGRSSNPVAMAGDRIVHMGIIKRTDEVLAKAAKENY
ncbi:N-alpha-acetyl-L-2,4-diaminobutyric acid deacetylase [Choanephora cucurbitarum]|uniref:N-alpha-acetyl-L-2,4-diaminobutyric acid deacetylase n=1 Tax=Choanephora cucurbitarum TaxID=101091 RepID=A0A1C7N2V0_9FUNG|nr:N-alpha-acetyl-L-2,4-diaminobutyric acid deacetylase [Choanephora cucurbitarum]